MNFPVLIIRKTYIAGFGGWAMSQDTKPNSTGERAVGTVGSPYLL